LLFTSLGLALTSVETRLVELATSQGIWATLFLLLLFFVLKTGNNREERLIQSIKDNEERSDKREAKLIQIIDGLRCDLNIIHDIKKGVKEIQRKIN